MTHLLESLWECTHIDYFYALIRACPILGTLALDPHSDVDLTTLQPILREFCPGLKVIYYITEYRPWEEVMYPISNNYIIAAIESVAPENLINVRIGLQVLEDDVIAAILKHEDSLETLEVVFLGFEDESFGNVARIPQRYKQPERLSHRALGGNWRTKGCQENYRRVRCAGGWRFSGCSGCSGCSDCSGSCLIWLILKLNDALSGFDLGGESPCSLS
ncbi:MAG: hypothetical protein J3R72DRAFT_174451 [Linnemannia gamsii]|nr:MAG: hypothetical protein J3R72DRAFT_174451 [Linnemannia gamsii]